MSPVADVEVASDVAGSLGFGTYLKGQWFAGPLTPSQQPQSIAYKELFPVVVAANVWDPQWCKQACVFSFRQWLRRSYFEL